MLLVLEARLQPALPLKGAGEEQEPATEGESLSNIQLT